MKTTPAMVSIIGDPAICVDLCLRKVLKFKDFSKSVILLDFTGRGALLLSRHNKMSIDRRKVVWVDLANRRSPVSIFQLKQSEHLKNAFLQMLVLLKRLSKITVSEGTLNWTAGIAEELSKNGLVGIAALLKSICSPEIRKHFFNSDQPPEDMNNLIKLLSWALKYPSVFCLSESPNAFRLDWHLKKKHIIWIEAKNEYFETVEHQLISGLIEIAVGKVLSDEKPEDVSIVHLFPRSDRNKTPAWVKETRQSIKHVSVHNLICSRKLSRLQLQWLRNSDSIWVPGRLRYPISHKKHSDWLMTKEIKRINSLKPGDLWMRSNNTGQYIVAKIKLPQIRENHAHRYRMNAAKNHQLIPFAQLSSAMDSFTGSEAKAYNLFEPLCNPDILRLGWVKVNKSANKHSQGVDRVTTAQFKKVLDQELSQLSFELEKGTYRCKPYRQVKIPKPDGGHRTISIPCIRDRVVQATCQLLMEPVFESSFSRFSFAYRPGRNAHQAVAIIKSFLRTGKKWAVSADIKRCFDNINHDYLVSIISRHIGDGRFIEVVRLLSEIGIIIHNESAPLITGIPMGSPLSPLLCNIYLDPLDKHLHRSGLSFVRYADDILILTEDYHRTQNALRLLEDFIIDPLLLELKNSKTHILSSYDGFEYLGFLFRNGQVGVRLNKMKKAMKVVSDLLDKLKNSELSAVEINDQILRFNSIVAGFRNYFAYDEEDNINSQLKLLDKTVNQIAKKKLNRQVTDVPAWICRERFFRSQHLDNINRSAKKTGLINSLGYNEETLQNFHSIESKSVTRPFKQAEYKKAIKPNESNLDFKNQLFEIKNRLFNLLHGCYMTVSKQDLIIKKNQKEIWRKPLDRYRLIYFQGFGQNVSIDFQVQATNMGTTLVLAPPLGIPMTVVNSITSQSSRLRTHQVLRKKDIDVITAGLKMLSAKVSNQASVLKYFAKYKKKQNKDVAQALNTAADRMREIEKSISLADPRSATVSVTAMGLEGHAAHIYWNCVKKILPSRYHFVKRVKKSAKDTINQCFNYAYGILYGEAWRAVTKAGLDPYFGIIHGAKRDNGSLIFDLIEEFRAPFADRLIIGMMGRGFLPESDDKTNYLKTRAKKKIAQGFSKRWFKKIKWQSKNISPSGIMEFQAKTLADVFLKKSKYRPYKMKW